MRWTDHGRRLALAATLAASLAPGAGCRRMPYIDQGKVVPRDDVGRAAAEDDQVTQASFLEKLPMPLPQMAPPRTTSNPETQEYWTLTLHDAIRIGLENSEVIRVIDQGAQGIPVSGFEPRQLGGGGAGQLGAGSLATVYDPAIQETNIAQALSRFDATLEANLLFGRNTTPVNNAFQAGTFAQGSRFPFISDQETAQFAAAINKRTATGGFMNITHTIPYQYSNFPNNAFPSVYTPNTQLRFTQPLLGGRGGSVDNVNIPAGQPTGFSGLEANRAPIVVARLRSDITVWGFKASVMALVRSIEQQYWILAQQHVRLWASETAVDLGKQIVEREQAEFEEGSGRRPDVAEAREQYERFRLQFVTDMADVINTERQLRNLLGLPPTDNRRIIPVTAPTEARLEPDWEASLAQMVTYHPDIVQRQLLVRIAELQLLGARNQLLPVLDFDALYQFNGFGDKLDSAEAVMTGATLRAINPQLAAQQRAAGLNPQPGNYGAFQSWQVGLTFEMPIGFRGPLANARQSQYILLQQRAFLQQTVHETTHTLYRFFLEVDANYKQFKTAGRLKDAALERLEAQKAFYEQGVITIDRYLDAVNRWANAVAQEADFKSRYNTAIAALEEAKGTLLAYDNIALHEGPWPRKAYVQARDQQAAHNQHPVPPDGPYRSMPTVGPANPDPVVPMPPPGLDAPSPLPALPAPIGPLGPPPSPAAPTVPAGEPNYLSGRDPGPAEPEVLPTSVPVERPEDVGPPTLPPLPGATPEAIDLPALPPS